MKLADSEFRDGLGLAEGGRSADLPPRLVRVGLAVVLVVSQQLGANAMRTHVRDLNLNDLKLFGDIVARLEHFVGERDVRHAIFDDITRLVRADYAASFVWNSDVKRFENAILHNMDRSNISRYENYYQYRDPHTMLLRAKRKATLIEEVNPYSELRKTEFYNDFLRRDGLHHGVNIFLFDGDRDLGDLRLWRAEASPDFGDREVGLLDALAPFLQRALLRTSREIEPLTEREREVVVLVAKGCRDREICNLLGISFSTVRTHLNKAMQKKAARTALNWLRCSSGIVTDLNWCARRVPSVPSTFLPIATFSPSRRLLALYLWRRTMEPSKWALHRNTRPHAFKLLRPFSTWKREFKKLLA